MQLINHRPTSAVEIQFLIENSEERLSEDQVSGVSAGHKFETEMCFILSKLKRTQTDFTY